MLKSIASFLIVVAVASLEAQTPSQATDGTAAVSGVVTRLDNDKPIAGIQLQLARVGSTVTRSSTVTAITDQAGAYRFEKLPPGAYTVTAAADRFFPADATFNRPQGAGKRVDLVEGQQLEKVNLVLAPAGAIEGRTLDEFGDPAPGVTLSVTQLVQAIGRSRLVPIPRATTVTDDRGAFRVFGLPPGDYYLSALSGPFGTQTTNAYSTPADTRAGFAPTYFPGTANAADAQPIHLAVGHDMLGVTFTLVPSRLFTVSGRVTDASGGSPAGPVMMLQTQGGDVRALIPANVTASANGAFVIRNVPQGSYVIQARTQRGFGTAMILVNDRDVTSVAITATPPRTARGRIVFEGGTPPAKEQVSVQVAPTDFVSGPAGGAALPRPRVNDDWTFELPGLQSVGTVVGGAPPNWRIRRVTVGGDDITDRSYDFRARDVTDLEVVFSDQWASVEANVLNAADQPAADCTVILFPADSTKWTYPSRYISTGRTNQVGVYTASGLPGGVYLAAAVPASVFTGEVDATLLESLRASATRVTLAEGVSVSTSLRLVR